MNDRQGFSLSQLLYDINTSLTPIKKWQDFEDLVVHFCRKQDPKCRRNIESDPDVVLSSGRGIEAKSITSLTRSVNLNSAAPHYNTDYVIAYHRREKIVYVAIVNGHNFYCKEIAEIQKTNTGMQSLSNKNVRFRNRIMWHLTNPFLIWGENNFIVDKIGNVNYF